MAHWLLKNPEFKEFPVPIKEFIEGTEYLKLKGKVYPRIQQELEEVFSGTVKDMYVKYEEVIFCAGIGSGKSYFSSVAVAYMIYCVACLKDPADYYHKSPGTHIYFMNMSVNQKSAQKVVFGEISERVNHSPWFRNNFFYDKNVTSELRFPKNISVIPGNSSETFFEGYNILGGIIDEADSHTKTEDKDAAEVGYDAIKGRIKSRFGRKGMVIIIGSPKTVDGFIMTRIKESEDRKSIHAVTLPIWEAHPKSEYCGRTFHFKSNLAELDVPVEYEDEFKRNPEKALRDLAAIPAYAAEPFFSFPEKVIDGFDPEMSHPMTFDGKFKLDFKCFDRVPRTVHIDLGLNKNGGDKCGLAMGHIKEMSKIGGEDLPIIKIDLMIRIPAPPGGEIQISDVRQIIYNLIDRGFHIFLVTMDGWQSADSLQQMKRRKIRAELSSIDRTTAPYESLKEAIYDGRLKYYKYDPFIDECVKLELVNGNKVDHQPKGSKDVSDAVAGVVYNLVTNKKSASGLSSWKNKFGTPRLTSEN